MDISTVDWIVQSHYHVGTHLETAVQPITNNITKKIENNTVYIFPQMFHKAYLFNTSVTAEPVYTIVNFIVLLQRALPI